MSRTAFKPNPKFGLLFGLLLVVHSAFAEVIVGKVVRVVDGDTLTILDAGKRQHKIRLEGIDAPERGQPFYKRSRQSLAALCAGKQGQAEYRSKDRYGRAIAKVLCDGVNANSEQVRRGFAWAFVRYLPLGSPFYELEAYARLRQLGLWTDARPMSPWDWRAKYRAKQRPRERQPNLQ